MSGSASMHWASMPPVPFAVASYDEGGARVGTPLGTQPSSGSPT